MVDLVKIRKKAKEKKESDEASRRVDDSARASDETPAAVESSSEKTTPGRKKSGRRTSASAATDVQNDVSDSVQNDAPSQTQKSSPKDVQKDVGEPRADQKVPAAPAPAAVSKLDRFKETAGKRREGEIVEEEEERGDRLELLTFVVAGEHYAIDIEHIVEIVTPRRVTRIPNADQSVVGIVSLRGTIVTLVDVRRKLGHPPAGEADDDTRIVIVDFHNETIGFTVDRVLRVVKTSPDEVEPHPVVHATELDESVRGVFRAGDALTILLDFEKLLDHSALAAVSA